MVKALTPVVLVSRNLFSAEWEISLHMDGVDIAEPGDLSMGAGALLGVYYIFGVRYAENVMNTFIFMQCMVGMKLNYSNH